MTTKKTTTAKPASTKTAKAKETKPKATPVWLVSLSVLLAPLLA